MNRMGTFVRITAANALLILIAATLISGCGSNDSKTPGNEGAQTAPPATAPSVTAPPATGTPGASTGYVILPIPVATAPGLLVEENDRATIDFSNYQYGYVMARFNAATGMQVRVLISHPDETEYTYRLVPEGGFGVLPLSGGNGQYLIRVLEQVEGMTYAAVLAVTVDVTLNDEFEPFLRPSQFVDFNSDNEVVRKAAELTAGANGLMEVISAIYGFVIMNIEYDVELAATVQSGYIPDLDRVLERRMGICFDYAAVMTAMLRSRGIPTKMVFGYVNEAYHAWISVFSKETGWIDEIIFFDGVTWRLMDPTFAASGDVAGAEEFIGDGSSYRVKFMY